MTIVELMVVMAVASVILALTLSVYRHAVRLSRQTACLSNLHQLALALNAYYTENGRLPADDRSDRLEEALAPLVKDRGVFHCPADTDPNASSYGPYYVSRRELDPRDFVLGCPRHSGGEVATVLFGSAGAEGNRLGRITHDGVPVSVGDRVTGGVLRFADGSVASIKDGVPVDIVTSFQRADGSYYTILRMPMEGEGAIGLAVNPRSRFEVVTPAAIAGSEGTLFYVITSRTEDERLRTVVHVKHGKVRVTSRGRAAEERLVVGKATVLAEFPAGTISNAQDPASNVLPMMPGGKQYGKP